MWENNIKKIIIICVTNAPLFLYQYVAIATDWNTSGHIGIESRYFLENPLYSSQTDEVQLSAFGEIGADIKSGENNFSLLAYARADNIDSKRTHMDIREAYWQRSFDELDILMGINTVFWGVAESQHLINIINTVDQLENVDREDFLGQPMFKLTLNKDIGQFSVFILPYFRELSFSDPEARLRAQLPINANAAVYLGDAKEDYVSSALRYAHYWGDWDVGLHYFHGVARDNVGFQASNVQLISLPNGNTTVIPTKFVPIYEIIDQLGADVQLTTDAWLLKLEVLQRNPKISDDYFSGVGGFEYSIYQLFNTNKDLGLLLEYSYDERESILLNNDIFFGTRLTWNDIDDTALLAGVIVDNDDDSMSLRFEAERRLNENWKLELEAQLFLNTAEGNPLYILRNDDFITLSIINYF